MEYRHLVLVLLLDASIVIHNSIPCSSSPSPLPYTFFDIAEFIRLLRKYHSPLSETYLPIVEENENNMDYADQLGALEMVQITSVILYIYIYI